MHDHLYMSFLYVITTGKNNANNITFCKTQV